MFSPSPPPGEVPSAPQPPLPQRVDRERLAFLRSLSPQQPDWLEQELIYPFLREARACREELQAALETANLAKVEKLAHDMASTCSMLGAKHLAEAARTLMYQARVRAREVPMGGAGFLTELEAVLAELRTIFPGSEA